MSRNRSATLSRSVKPFCGIIVAIVPISTRSVPPTSLRKEPSQPGSYGTPVPDRLDRRVAESEGGPDLVALHLADRHELAG